MRFGTALRVIYSAGAPMDAPGMVSEWRSGGPTLRID